MRKNVGRMDAWIRGALALLLFSVAAVFNRFLGVSLLAALAALVLVATALTRSCPLYRALGIGSEVPRTHGP